MIHYINDLQCNTVPYDHLLQTIQTLTALCCLKQAILRERITNQVNNVRRSLHF